jgi:hypothetical protein
MIYNNSDTDPGQSLYHRDTNANEQVDNGTTVWTFLSTSLSNKMKVPTDTHTWAQSMHSLYST